MNLRKLLTFSFTFVALFSLAPVNALACACCADTGEYSISVSKPKEFELTTLKQMRFANSVQLFTGAADVEDAAKGILHPAESYSLSGAMNVNSWKLGFSEGSNSGTLNLQLPATFVSYKVDTRDTADTGLGPVLYKEWRFSGRVTGTGIFRPGLLAPAKYFLVFQGRGNRCDSSEDFKHWRLEITGSRARYSFFGDLGTPNP